MHIYNKTHIIRGFGGYVSVGITFCGCSFEWQPASNGNPSSTFITFALFSEAHPEHPSVPSPSQIITRNRKANHFGMRAWSILVLWPWPFSPLGRALRRSALYSRRRQFEPTPTHSLGIVFSCPQLYTTKWWMHLQTSYNTVSLLRDDNFLYFDNAIGELFTDIVLWATHYAMPLPVDFHDHFTFLYQPKYMNTLLFIGSKI